MSLRLKRLTRRVALGGGSGKSIQAVAEIRKLPAEQQDKVAELLIELASEGERLPSLTPEQVEGVRLALRQAELGQFATGESVERLLYRPWT